MLRLKILKLNLNTMDKCRTCLSNNNLTINIFNNSTSERTKIYTKIMSLAKVQIQPNDGLPTLICTNCEKTLDICLQFIKLCEKSDYELRKSIIDIKEENLATDLSMHETTRCYTTIDGPPVIKNYNKDEIKTEVNEAINSIYTLKDADNLKINNKASQKQQCFTCGKVMSSRFRLKTHLATHAAEKPFTCPHCDKKFSIAQNLTVHIRIHTGEKPFVCKICGKSFAQSSGLTTHKRKHSGQMPYQCVLCPRSFRTIGHLQYHVRRHTGEKKYECDKCSRAFITRSDLKQHILTHNGEKPHVCSICGIKLSRASNLKRHIKLSHSEGKSFICTECPSKFARKSDLLKHEKKHTTNVNKEINNK